MTTIQITRAADVLPEEEVVVLQSAGRARRTVSRMLEVGRQD